MEINCFGVQLNSLDRLTSLTAFTLTRKSCGFLENLPEFLFRNSKNLTELNLMDCITLRLNKNHFYGLDNLKILNYGGEFIEEIDNIPGLKKLVLNGIKFNEFSLKGFDNLESLFLINVKFTKKTSKDLFKNLKNLKEFHFCNTLLNFTFQELIIKELLPNVNVLNSQLECKHDLIEKIYSEKIPFFENLTSLEILFEKSYNSLNNFFLFKEDLFPSLASISLNIEETSNREISFDVLKNMKNLKNLELKGLILDTDSELSLLEKAEFTNFIPKNISHFSNLKALSFLKLNQKIDFTENFLENFLHLEELYLCDVFNSFEDSTVQCLFKNLGKLKKLYLCHGSIKRIESSFFDYLVNLEELKLRSNKIEVIDSGSFKNLTKLESLDLSDNDLKNINKETFTGLNNLKILNLKYNKSVQITKEDLAEMSRLEMIYLF